MNHITEQIEAYLTGGLSADERAEFEAHEAVCPACAQALAAAQAVDASMTELFSTDQPSPDFEDRMIAAIQMPRPWLSRPIVHPAVRRVAVGIAASLMVGAIGYLGSVASRDGHQPADALARNITGAPLPAQDMSRRRGVSSPATQPESMFSDLSTGFQSSDPVDFGMQLGTFGETSARSRVRDRRWSVNGSANEHELAQPSGQTTPNKLGWYYYTAPQQAQGQQAQQTPKDGVVVPSVPQSTPALQQTADGRDVEHAMSTGRSYISNGGDKPQLSDQADLSLNSTTNMATAAGAKPAEAKYAADALDAYMLPTDGAGVPGNIGKPAIGNGGGGGGGGGGSSAGNPAGGFGGNTGRGRLEIAGQPGAAQPDTSKPAESSYFALAYNGKVDATKAAGDTVLGGRDQFRGLKDGEALDGKKSEELGVKLTTGIEAAPGAKGLAELTKATSDEKNEPVQLGRDEQEKLAQLAEKTPDKNSPASGVVPVPAATPVAPPPAAPVQQTAPPPANPPVQAPALVAPQPEAHVTRPKIIRSGEMEFEVDGFDSCVNTLTKIVTEEGGYVSTTNSDKLPNGKVKGSVVLRVTPEHLDTLVLKLRGIGDLKTQRIGAQDITKEYTDLESGLHAAQAMYERLLDIIKNGKGQVKDLLEAEKQLGNWREKVEKLQGEINYYNNLVSYSTLTLTLYERDIRTPAQANETETVTMTLVTEKVDEAYNKAKDAIDQAKGRIVASDLKQHDAGEFLGTITAQVPPDKADAVIGLIRQINGQLAHFDRQRSQTTSNGNAPVDPRSADLVKVKREDVTISLTLYNLANIKPRRWTTMTLAAANVDDAYRTLIDEAKTAGGRVVDSRIEHPKPDMTTGVMTLDIPAEKADSVLLAAKSLGEMLQINTTENASTQDVTETKRGLQVTIYNLANIAPRRWTTLTLVATNVDESYRALIEHVKAAGGRVTSSKIEHPKPEETTGAVTLDVPLEKSDALLAALRAMGEPVQITTTDNADTQNTTDSKRGFTVSLRSLSTFAAREQQQVQLASLNVPATFKSVLDLLRGKSSRIVTSHLDEQDRTNAIGSLEFDISREALSGIEAEMDKDGQVVTRLVDRSTDTENTVDSKVHVKLAIGSSEQLPPRQSTDMNVQVNDVQKAMDDLEAAALQAGGRQIDNPGMSQTENGQVLATVRMDVPLNQLQKLIDTTDGMGLRKSRQTSIDARAPEGKLARARLSVTFATQPALAGVDEGMWAGIRRGLSTSLIWLGHIATYLIVGLFVVLPCALIAWGGWRGVKWTRRGRKPATA